jgi:DNA processing protein
MLARIAEEGLVVSEQPPGQVPMKSRFLSRNRIIAALTRGTVVVEARRRSGSLNTLGWADRLGRVTMAVPGPVTSPQSVGPHVAVREGRAILVSSGADVADELAALGAASPERDADADVTAWDALAPELARVLDALDWKTPLDVDEVARRARVSRAAAERALDRLTRAGWVAAAGPRSWLLERRADLAPPAATRTVGE